MAGRVMQYVKNAAVVSGAFLALAQLWTWFSPLREGRLEVTATYGDFRLPPAAAREFQRIRQVVSRDSLNSVLTTAPLGSLARRNLADILQMYFLARIPEAVPYGLTQLEGYWAATVTNATGRSLKSVTLTLPNAGSARVSRAGAPATTFDSLTDVIQLGTMRPTETVDVFAWTRSDIYGTDPGRVSLTHDDGVGTVKIMASTGRLGQAVENYGSAVGLVLLLLVIWGTVALVSYKVGHGSNAGPVSNDTGLGTGAA